MLQFFQLFFLFHINFDIFPQSGYGFSNFLPLPDKPGKPEGPLEVSDVHADHVKLAWKKPKHTGGLPLAAYVVEKMDTLTGKWVPAGTVEPDTTEATVTGE